MGASPKPPLPPGSPEETAMRRGILTSGRDASCRGQLASMPRRDHWRGSTSHQPQFPWKIPIPMFSRCRDSSTAEPMIGAGLSLADHEPSRPPIPDIQKHRSSQEKRPSGSGTGIGLEGTGENGADHPD
jgi:hypothetical protein